MPHDSMLDMLKVLVSIPSLPMCIAHDDPDNWRKREIRSPGDIARAQNLDSYSEFTQNAWSLLNDCYMSSACLCFRPEALASASLYLAYRQRKVELGISDFETIRLEEEVAAAAEDDDDDDDDDDDVDVDVDVDVDAKRRNDDNDDNNDDGILKSEKKKMRQMTFGGESTECEIEERGIISESDTERGKMDSEEMDTKDILIDECEDGDEWLLDLSLSNFWYKHLAIRKKEILDAVHSLSKLYGNAENLTDFPIYADASSDEDNDDDDDDDSSLTISSSTGMLHKGKLVKTDSKDTIKMITTTTTTTTIASPSMPPSLTSSTNGSQIGKIVIPLPQSIKTPSSSPPSSSMDNSKTIKPLPPLVPQPPQSSIKSDDRMRRKDISGGSNDMTSSITSTPSSTSTSTTSSSSSSSGDRRRKRSSDRKKSSSSSSSSNHHSSSGSHHSHRSGDDNDGGSSSGRMEERDRHGSEREKSKGYHGHHGHHSRDGGNDSSDDGDDGSSRKDRKRSRYSKERYSKPGHSRHRNDPYERR